MTRNLKKIEELRLDKITLEVGLILKQSNISFIFSCPDIVVELLIQNH